MNNFYLGKLGKLHLSSVKAWSELFLRKGVKEIRGLYIRELDVEIQNAELIYLKSMYYTEVIHDQV